MINSLIHPKTTYCMTIMCPIVFEGLEIKQQIRQSHHPCRTYILLKLSRALQGPTKYKCPCPLPLVGRKAEISGLP